MWNDTSTTTVCVWERESHFSDSSLVSVFSCNPCNSISISISSKFTHKNLTFSSQIQQQKINNFSLWFSLFSSCLLHGNFFSPLQTHKMEIENPNFLFLLLILISVFVFAFTVILIGFSEDLIQRVWLNSLVWFSISVYYGEDLQVSVVKKLWFFFLCLLYSRVRKFTRSSSWFTFTGIGLTRTSCYSDSVSC